MQSDFEGKMDIFALWYEDDDSFNKIGSLNVDNLQEAKEDSSFFFFILFLLHKSNKLRIEIVLFIFQTIACWENKACKWKIDEGSNMNVVYEAIIAMLLKKWIK